MSDVVVTCPQWFWEEWIDEGHLPGEEWDGESEYHFHLGGAPPTVKPGERVYIVALGKLRGYAPLVRIDYTERGYGLVRRDGAVAVTLPQLIRGFRGFRYRFWDYADEVPFPNWRQP